MEAQALTIEQVIDYAKPLVHSYVSKVAADAPREHKQEIEQAVYLRLLKAFPRFDPKKGQFSFVYTHVRGAVLDYLKFGRGFAENRWSLSKSPNEARTPKLTKRVQQYSSGESDDEVCLDQLLGENKKFQTVDFDKINIRWDLVARLASNDDHLHAFARNIRGQTIEEMAPVFGVVRTRVSQMIQMFIGRFDDPACADDPYFKQVCYAFGLCKALGMEDKDQSEVMGFSMGWKLEPVDLDSISDQVSQMGFFDEEDENAEDEN